MSDLLLLALMMDPAREGDPDKAREVLALAAELLNANKPLEKYMRAYLAEAFTKIANGMNPSAAFYLNKRRGLKPRIDRYQVYLDCMHEIDQGTSQTQAFITVAERHHCDVDTAKKAYLVFRKAARENEELLWGENQP